MPNLPAVDTVHKSINEEMKLPERYRSLAPFLPPMLSMLVATCSGTVPANVSRPNSDASCDKLEQSEQRIGGYSLPPSSLE